MIRSVNSLSVNTDVCIDYSIDERTTVSRCIVIHHWPLIHCIINQLDPHPSLPHLPPSIVLRCSRVNGIRLRSSGRRSATTTMSMAKSHPIFQERKSYGTSRLIHQNLADVDAFASRSCLLPTDSPNSSRDSSTSMPSSLKRLSMETDRIKKKEKRKGGARGKRKEQVLSCFLDPTRDGVRGELIAVSFVTIKVEVWISSSRDTRDRLDDLSLRDIADTTVYAMKLSDGNRAFSLPRGRITSSREK